MSSTPPSGPRSGPPTITLAREATEGAETFRFVVPARLEYRDAVRAFLSQLCDRIARSHELPPDVHHRVISSFVEAFNNAAIHAYADLPTGVVDVTLQIEPGRIALTICDEGRSFVPETIPEPDLDALPEGGLGLFIMRNFMDSVRYERAGSRNYLIMEKRLVGGAAPGPSPEGAPKGEGHEG
jgi:serine/threonine-protein kinase RsbW